MATILQHKWDFFSVTVGNFETETLLLFSFEAKLILTRFFLFDYFVVFVIYFDTFT